jgi:hypothetical protein
MMETERRTFVEDMNSCFLSKVENHRTILTIVFRTKYSRDSFMSLLNSTHPRQVQTFSAV